MKTHWKKQYNYDYMGDYSIPEGTEPIYTIDRTEKQIVTQEGGKKEECFVIYFKEHKKPMILNRTNSKAIENAYKTPYIEDWPGKKVQLYVQEGVQAFGKVVDALRIRPFPPIIKLKEMKEGSDAWNRAIEYYKENKNIDRVKSSFKITEEQESKIKELAI